LEKSNLLTILRSLDKKEVKELKKWLDSPAHNQREDVQKLYQYLFSDKRLEKGKNLGKEKAFKSVFPEVKTYDDAKMRQCMFFFLKALEEFLVYEALMADEMYSKALLAKTLRKKRIEKSFDKNFNSAIRIQGQQKIRNFQFYLNDYLIRSEKVQFQALGKKVAEIDFQGLNDSLDIYYLADKLRQSTTMISHQTVYKKSYDLGLTSYVLDYLKEKPEHLEIPAIGMYYYALKCSVEREDSSHFINFKRQITEFGHFFPLFEVRDLNLAAINYCINKMNSGENEYWREAFELYHFGFQRQILMIDGYISKSTFQNFVSIGMRLKEYELIGSFIEEYNSFLEPKHRENIFHYSNSLLHFEKGNYEEAMDLLNQVEYDDIPLTLAGKTILIRMYYELDYDDALDSLISSTKAYIQRKKLLAYHKTSYSNFLKLITKLSKINPYDRSEKEKLVEKINAQNPVAAKQWLLEQVKSL